MKPPPAQRRGGGGHHEDIWNEASTLALLEAWGRKMPRQRHHRRGYGPLSRLDWSHITQQVLLTGTPFKSETQCRNRIDTLKKKYKREKRKQEALAAIGDGSPSSWVFFEKMDELLNCEKNDDVALDACPSNGGSDENEHDDDVVSNDAHMLERMQNGIHRTWAADGEDDDDVGVLKDAKGEAIMPSRDQNGARKGYPWNSDLLRQNVGNGDGVKNANGRLRHGHTRPCKRHNSSSCDDSQASDDSSDHEDSCGKSKEWMHHQLPLLALGKAVEVFVEMYEKVETAKQKQALELEKARMEIIKKFELQKWQLFMQTKMELAKINGSNINTDADMDARLFATCFMPLDYCL